MDTVTTIFILLAAYQLKHWLCDYPLQRPFMLRKGGVGWNWSSLNNLNWILPLAAHASVHAFGTLLIVAWYAGLTRKFTGANKPLTLLLLALLDFVVHFSVKASPALGGRWKADSPYFWWALGADQAAHHLTHYFIVYRLVCA